MGGPIGECDKSKIFSEIVLHLKIEARFMVEKLYKFYNFLHMFIVQFKNNLVGIFIMNYIYILECNLFLKFLILKSWPEICSDLSIYSVCKV